MIDHSLNAKVGAKFGAKITTGKTTQQLSFFDKTLHNTLVLIRYLGLLQRKAGFPVDDNWKLFSYVLCGFYWIWTFRVLLLYAYVTDKAVALYMLDITYFWPGERKIYLTVEAVYGLLAALITTHFIVSIRSSSWLETLEEMWMDTDDVLYPLDREVVERKYQVIKVYVFRIIGVFFLMQVFFIGVNFDAIKNENLLWELIISYSLFSQLSYSSIVVSSLYFIQTCFFVNDRFGSVIHDLNESLKQFNKISLDPSAEKEKEKELPYAEKIKLIQRRHLKICEMLHCVNGFWNLWLFFVICILLPFAFFITYEAVFGSAELQQRVLTAWFGCSAWVVVGLITVNSASVSGNAHRPLEVLFNITLNTNLPFDLKVKLKDFIQRLNGPTIGLECLSFFVVTQSQIYSVSMALISYFLILMSMGERHKFDNQCTLENGTVVSDTQFRAIVNQTLFLLSN